MVAILDSFRDVTHITSAELGKNPIPQKRQYALFAHQSTIEHVVLVVEKTCNKRLKHVHRRVTRHIGPAFHIGPRANMELPARYAWYLGPRANVECRADMPGNARDGGHVITSNFQLVE